MLPWATRDKLKDNMEEVSNLKDQHQEEPHNQEVDHVNQTTGRAFAADEWVTFDDTAECDSHLNNLNPKFNNQLLEQEEDKLLGVVEYKKSARSSLVLGYLKQVSQLLTLFLI